MELSSLARLTHSRHFDTIKHGEDGLLVPAGLIIALATSLSARDLHEVCADRGRSTACRKLNVGGVKYQLGLVYSRHMCGRDEPTFFLRLLS